MKFLLIDYQPPGTQINRDQTGTYGSDFTAGGLTGRLLMRAKKGGVRLPVVSFSYAAAMLRAAGHEVEVHTGMPEQGGDAALFATAMYHYKVDLAFLEQFRSRHPGTLVGLLGGFSQHCPEAYGDVADFVVAGEIEPALRAFIAGEWDLRGRFEAGVEDDLAALPLPDWDGFPVDRYSYAPILPKPRFLPVQTMRGCAHACPFCPYVAVQGRKFRFRPVEAVEAECRMLVEKYDVRSVLFRDVVFSATRKRTLRLCEALSRLPRPLEWACETRLDSLDEELVREMSRAGMKAINLGIESADEESLARFGKGGYTQEHVVKAVTLLHKYGVKVQAFYILGTWEDTLQTMEATIDFACRLNTYSAQFCVATAFPGTEYFEDCKPHLLHTDFTKYTEYEPVVATPGASPREVVRFRDAAYRRFYLRPRWILKHGLGAVAALAKKRLTGPR